MQLFAQETNTALADVWLPLAHLERPGRGIYLLAELQHQMRMAFPIFALLQSRAPIKDPLFRQQRCLHESDECSPILPRDEPIVGEEGCRAMHSKCAALGVAMRAGITQ